MTIANSKQIYNVHPRRAAEIVREFRCRMGWTQREAAEWFGVGIRTWQRYESTERKVPTPLLRSIARELAPMKRRG